MNEKLIGYTNCPEIVTDDTIIWFGKHKKNNLTMEELPADYLLFLYEERKDRLHKPLLDYIEDNYEVLIKERNESNPIYGNQDDFF